METENAQLGAKVAYALGNGHDEVNETVTRDGCGRATRVAQKLIPASSGLPSAVGAV